MEGGKRFVDRIADGIWSTCEESFWGFPAHLGKQQAGLGLPDVENRLLSKLAAYI